MKIYQTALFLLFTFCVSSTEAQILPKPEKQSGCSKQHKLPTLFSDNISKKLRLQILDNIDEPLVNRNNIVITELSPNDNLPWFRIFSIKNRKLRHNARIYFQNGKKFYLSTKRSDFKKILKDNDILSTSLALEAFLDIYQVFFIGNQTYLNHSYIIRKKDLHTFKNTLKKDGIDYKKNRFTQVSAPKFTRNPDKTATIIFYIKNSNQNIDRINFVFTKDYTFTKVTNKVKAKKQRV